MLTVVLLTLILALTMMTLTLTLAVVSLKFELINASLHNILPPKFSFFLEPFEDFFPPLVIEDLFLLLPTLLRAFV